MAGYLGSVPVPQATQHRESFTCTEGQTSFATAGYTPQFLDLYLNGSHLSPADFTATNGSDVVLGVAASADDVCDIISYTPFEVANQTFTGTTTIPDLVVSTVTGTGTTFSSPSYNVIKIQTDSDDNGSNDDAILQFTNGSGNTVKGELRFDESTSAFEIGFGDNQGHITLNTSGVVINEDSRDHDFRVESNGLPNMFHVDGGEDKIFIGHGATHSYDAYGTQIMMQLEAVGTAPYAGFGMIQNSNDTDSAVLIFGKSRGTALAATTIVQDGDVLGRIEFQGMDGDDLETGCSIFGMVDGTPGANDMPGRLVFLTTPDGANSATVRMKIDSVGNKIMQDSTHAAVIDGSASGASFNGSGSLFSSRATGSTSIHFRFFNSTGGSTAVGSISTNSSATAYNTSSDYRLKENVDYNWDATTRLKQLKPARFNFISDDTNTLIDGFLAHEVSSIVPEAITGEKDGVQVWDEADELPVWVEGEELPDGVSVGDTKVSAGDNKLDADGNTTPDMQGIDQSKLVPLLVKTIQELEARITALEG